MTREEQRAYWRSAAARWRARLSSAGLEAERARCRLYGKTQRKSRSKRFAGVLILAAVTLALASVSCSPVDYDSADIHDVSREHDALRVYHDTARGVTCYGGGGFSSISCLPDLWLHCDGGCR
jgi:hypothetical protein